MYNQTENIFSASGMESVDACLAKTNSSSFMQTGNRARKASGTQRCMYVRAMSVSLEILSKEKEYGNL